MDTVTYCRGETAEDRTPKLAIFSSQWTFPEPQGTKTPPLRAPASVPFKWEEAPGRPKATTPTLEIAPSACLHLPPRLDHEKITLSGRGFDSPSACPKLFGAPSHRRRPEFDSPSGFPNCCNNSNPELQSPRSILTGPNARSRGSSSSSQDSASALADTCALIAGGDDAAAPQHCGLPRRIASKAGRGAAARRNIRNLVDLWSKGLRRRMKRGEKQPSAESDAWQPTCHLRRVDVARSPGSSFGNNIVGKEDKRGLKGFAVAKDGLTGATSLPRVYSPRCSRYAESPARCRRGSVLQKRRRRWVFGKLKRSSTFLAAIWKRASRAVSSRSRKMPKPRKSQPPNSYRTL